jgi:DNA repair protein RecO (recombination protein O)
VLSKSQVIVLHTIKYGDNGIVLQCYSNTCGRQAVFLRVSARNKVVLSNLHRLGILDIVTWSNGSSMPTVKEMEPVVRLDSIRTNIYKNTIAIFLSELLVKCIKESEANLQLYQFLVSSISVLEHMEGMIANFHIHFLVHLSKMLGFMPVDNFSAANPLFDIHSARFVGVSYANSAGSANSAGRNADCFPAVESELLHTVLNTPAIECSGIRCSGEVRLAFAKQMIKYLSVHLGINFDMKSLDVLHEVFN